MSEAQERTIAIKAVMDLIQFDAEPKLTQGEIELEIDRAKIAAMWQVNTAYSVGSLVVPVVRNGHYYECIQPGTSQATARSYADWPTKFSQQLVDGSSDPALTWEEAGADIFNASIEGARRNIFDISRAARECWLLKARRAAPLIDDGGLSFSQIYKHCMEQADRFHPFRRPAYVARG